MTKIRVLLADDHPLVRAGLKSTLAAAKAIELVAEATSGDEVQRLCREQLLDVVLLDLNMPGPPPHETVAYLNEQCPAVKVLILTAYDDDAYCQKCSNATPKSCLQFNSPTKMLSLRFRYMQSERKKFM